ncbi:MAG TPA: DUF1697 domain-containing protein [Anaerovoracaceae bacterium]|nr:DUF1697 domain-containing protein [Anaerovoracaceae bacterium]
MRYIALLRGINVGGNNKVSMKALKTCFEKAGFHNVTTYINSGNVLFDSEESSIPELIKICGDSFEKEFRFPVNLAVIDGNALKEALEHAPEWWGDDPDSKHNAIFVVPPATAEEICIEAGTIKPEYEKVYAYQNVIFWSAPLKTFSRTRWSKIVGTKAYQSITIRNANTAKKLLELVFEK